MTPEDIEEMFPEAEDLHIFKAESDADPVGSWQVTFDDTVATCVLYGTEEQDTEVSGGTFAFIIERLDDGTMAWRFFNSSGPLLKLGWGTYGLMDVMAAGPWRDVDYIAMASEDVFTGTVVGTAENPKCTRNWNFGGVRVALSEAPSQERITAREDEFTAARDEWHAARGDSGRRVGEAEEIIDRSGLVARAARVQYFALFARDLSIIEFPPEVQPQADEVIALSLEASRLSQLVLDAPRNTTIEGERLAAARAVTLAVNDARSELALAMNELGMALGLIVPDEGENDEVAPVASED